MKSNPFVVGSSYSHDFIMKELSVGNSGGIRVAAADRNSVARVVLFSTSSQEANPQENPYNDRLEGAILTYTGSGKIGDQDLSGRNLRITQQSKYFFPIYVFSLLSHRKTPGSPDNRWQFSGIYKYLDHSRESQMDLLGSDRNAWIFKLVRLEIEEAHPRNESRLRKLITDSFSDPMFSPQILLSEPPGYLAHDIDKAIGMMNNLEPTAFESFIKCTLIASKFREVRVTKKSSDGGVDVIARMPLSVWPIESQIIQVQVKRWLRPIGRREVAELRGSLHPRAIGVLVTTGNYARTAILEAGRPNLLPISLVDGHRLATVAMQLKLLIN